MEKLKNISIIALAYLTICGSLYYLVFWKAFNLNGFSYLNFTDIVRSSLYSILSNQYVFILLILILFSSFWEGTARKLGTSKIKILDEAIWRFSFMENLAKNLMVAEFIRAFIIFIPLICYVAAKVNSENILQNIEYKFIIRDKANSADTLKYIANSGTNYIFTDLNNQKVILLKLDSVTLYNKK